MRLIAVFMSLLVALAQPVHAQDRDLPHRPIAIYVPFATGSGADITAHFFAGQLAAQLGQAVIVEARPGGRGTIGVVAVKNAPPDGRAILMASHSPIAVNPVTIKDLPYDPQRDLKPVAGAMRGMNALVVSSQSGIRTLADLVAAARQGRVTVGTYSEGYRMVMEWLSSRTGVHFVDVPYPGGAPLFADIVGGRVDVGLSDFAAPLGLIQAGRLRVLAVTGETRHPDFPQVPTVRESGYPDFVNYGWTSFYVRAETPPDVTARLEEALQAVVRSPATRDFAREHGAELMPYDAARMRAFQDAEIARFRRIAESAGIRPQ